jgi:hypothetical protein
VTGSETVDTSGSPASATSCLFRDPPFAHFENKQVQICLHFPVSYISQGNRDLKRSTALQTNPRWIIPKESVQETPTPELMTARTCQVSGSQRTAEDLKLHRILRKATNSSGLPSKNCSNLPTTVQERDPPSFGFLTRANTC